MNTEFRDILFEVSDGVGTITLNRPERLNSIADATHGELRAALAQVRADKAVRALVLTGTGRAFCAGQDLNDRKVAPGGAPPEIAKRQLRRARLRRPGQARRPLARGPRRRSAWHAARPPPRC
ncbi:MAG: enoyl-CoA hydratase-related protein, partial [Burkholderiales bacterium]